MPTPRPFNVLLKPADSAKYSVPPRKLRDDYSVHYVNETCFPAIAIFPLLLFNAMPAVTLPVAADATLPQAEPSSPCLLFRPNLPRTSPTKPLFRLLPGSARHRTEIPKPQQLTRARPSSTRNHSTSPASRMRTPVINVSG